MIVTGERAGDEPARSRERARRRAGACGEGDIGPAERTVDAPVRRETVSGIGADRAAVAGEFSAQACDRVVEMLVAGDQANQEIGSELVTDAACDVHLVAVGIHQRVVAIKAGTAHVDPGAPVAIDAWRRFGVHVAGIAESGEGFIGSARDLRRRLGGEVEPDPAWTGVNRRSAARREGVADRAVDGAGDRRAGVRRDGFGELELQLAKELTVEVLIAGVTRAVSTCRDTSHDRGRKGSS